MKKLLFIAGILSVFAISLTAFAAKSSQVQFYHWLEADEDVGQCNDLPLTVTGASLGEWTDKVKIDTDDRDGGCYQKFAIYDPDRELGSLLIQVDFQSDGIGQCDLAGKKNIPLNRDIFRGMKWSNRYRIDTDERFGGCTQKFSMLGGSGYALDIDFSAEDDKTQCGNTGISTVTKNKSVTLRLDTDDRAGGCFQKFRLRKL